MDKKGVSIIIGYVLLIAISIAISVLVFQWIKTYVPKDALSCPEGTSLLIRETNYDCDALTLSVTVQNNGKFNIHGYLIYVSDNDDQGLATINLYEDILTGGYEYGSNVIFSEITDNSLSPTEPNNIQTTSFDVSNYGQLYKVEIVPIRVEDYEGKTKIASCSDAKISAKITCAD